MKYFVCSVLLAMSGAAIGQSPSLLNKIGFPRLTHTSSDTHRAIEDDFGPLSFLGNRADNNPRKIVEASLASPGTGILIAKLNPFVPSFGAVASPTSCSFYVANAGDDSNDGLTTNTPWRTLAMVNAQTFMPGNTICFLRGDNWNAQADAPLIVSSSGSAGNPITYTAYGTGPLPVIDGQKVVGNVLQTNSQSFIVIDSLQVQNSQNYLLYVNNCNGCSITNNTLMNGGLYGIEVAGTSPNVTISRNTYSLTAGFVEIGPGIDCNTSLSPGCVISNNSVDLRNVDPSQSPSGILCRNSATCSITGNTIQMANGDQGIGLKASGAGHMIGSQIIGNSITGLEYTATCPISKGCDAEAIELTGYDSNHLVMNSVVSGNFMQNNAGTSSDCIGVDRAGSNTISYNLCIAPPTQSAIMHVSGPGTTGNLIYGNSAYGSQQGMTFLGTGVTNDVQNNIMVGATIRGINFQIGATGTYDYNLAWHNGTGTGTSDNYVGGTDGGHNLVADPQWTNSPPASANDFTLQSTSPAIDSGADLGTAYELANDPNSTFPYAQVDQNLYGGWERGAFVYADPSNPAVTFSPPTLAFAAQAVGTNSNPSVITVTNAANVSLNIGSITITGPDATQFSMTQNCGTSLAAGATCNINVTFSPTLVGAKSAAVSVSDDATGSPQSVPLSGTATAGTSGVGLTPASLSFGNQTIGTSSTSQSITLTNTGTAVLNIASILMTGTDTVQFAVTQTCAATLAVNTSCTISVTFSPTTSGARSAAVTITDDATGSPQSVPLSGTGTAPGVGLAPSSLSFGNQTVGTSSTPQSITLTNTGTSVLNLASIALTGTDAAQFSKSQTCTATLAVNTSCTISVTFSPTTSGARSAAVTITDDAAGSPQSVPLSGTGTAPGVGLAPSSLSFGNQTVGTSSTPQSITLTNTGTSVLNLASIALTGTDAAQFSKSQTCTATLAVNTSCTISVTFSPTTSGARSAAVTITDDATGSPQSVPLSGTGTAPGVGLAPSSLSFGNQTVGTSSTPQSITLTNTGTSVLNLASIALTGTDAAQFSKSQTCAATLAVNTSCTISVTFSPTTSGARSAAVTITDDATGSPQSVPLSGTGTAPGVGLAPTSLSFGNQTVGTSSTPQSITLTNTGTSVLNLASIALTGTDAAQFSKSQTCAATLAVNTSCTISVTFSPTTSGARSAAVTITDDATGSPQSVPLSGTGTAPGVGLAPTSLSFGNQTVGTSSTPQLITLTNTGTSVLNLASIALTGTDAAQFSKSQTCAATLAVNTSCTISVTFSPTTSGARSAAVTITDDATGSPQSVPLSGTGTAPGVGLAPSSLSFGNQTVGTSSTPQSITLTNTGTSVLNLASIALTGTDAAQFSKSQTCTATLAVNTSCTISVTFSPTTSGARSAAVTITDDATGSPQSVPLSGTGTAPGVGLAPTSLSFGNQTVGTSSTPQSITLTNTGTSVLNLASIALTGTDAAQFSKSQTCAATLAVNTSCTISVTFSPTTSGARSAAVTITDDATGSPQSVPLSGTGTAPGVGLAPSSLSFGNQTVGTSSTPQSITLTNTGTSVLNLASIALTGTDAAQFSKSQTCAATLAVNTSCTISVTFSPTTSGARSAAVTITDDATGSPQSVGVTGTGVGTTANLSSTTVKFATQAINTTSATTNVTLSNTGAGRLDIANIVISGTNSGDFSQANNCGTVLAAHTSCTVALTFTPTATGTRSATLIITDDASNGSQTASLSGTGISQVTLSASNFTFGQTVIGAVSAAKSLTLTNNKSTTLSVTGVVISGTNSGDFSQTNTCGTSVPAKSTCTITLTFKPTATGTRSASVTITDSANNSPQAATLSGTGLAQAVISPASLSFGTLARGSTSAAKLVTLTNNKSGALTISSIAMSGTNSGDFLQTNTCGTSVPAQSICTISVKFKPTAVGTRSAAVTVTDNASNSPQTVTLTGTGK